MGQHFNPVAIPAGKSQATGDFNGDGRDDLLWRNTDGTVTEWLGQANGGFASNGPFNTNAMGPDRWQIAAIGDFNGDGRDDILWRNDSGDLTNWLGQPTAARQQLGQFQHHAAFRLACSGSCIVLMGADHFAPSNRRYSASFEALPTNRHFHSRLDRPKGPISDSCFSSGK